MIENTEISMKQNIKQSENKVLIFAFLFLFGTGLFYWLIFFPGIMSYDSFDQWNQLLQFNFHNWHPMHHTLINWLITRIYLSPATISLAQILSFALIGTYTFSEFLKWDIPSKYIYFTLGLLFLIPIAFVMNMILWKNIFSAFFMLWLCILLLKIIRIKTDFFGSWKNILELFFVSFNFSWVKHGNFFILIFIFIGLFVLLQEQRKKQLSIYLSIIFVSFLLNQLTLNYFDPAKTKRSNTTLILLHYHLSSIIHHHQAIPKELTFLEEKYHLDKNFWSERYYPDNLDILYLGALSYEQDSLIKNNFANWNGHLAQQMAGKENSEEYHQVIKAIISYYLKHPLHFLENRLIGSQIVWKPFGLSFNYKYSFWHLENADNNDFGFFHEKLLGVKLFDFFAFKFHDFPLIWNPANWLYLFLILGLILWHRSKNSLYIIMFLPSIGQMGLLFFLNAHQSFRYVYGPVLVAMFFIPFLISLVLKTKKI